MPVLSTRMPALPISTTRLLCPPELRKAHQNNDRAVMLAYGFSVRDMTESKCVAELMKMYQALTEKQ